MLKLGNVLVFLDGLVVVPPYYSRMIFSLLGLASILVLQVPFFVVSFEYNKALFGVFFALSLGMFLLASFCLAKTALTDPGIIPGREFQDFQIAELKALLSEKQRVFQYQQLVKPKYTLNLNTKSGQFQQVPDTYTPAFKAINSNHQVMTPLKFSCLDYQFTAKYCQTCRFYRPLRATHGSKSNCCIQRYDHFCAWIGGDVGLHNLGWFYLMLGSVAADLVFSILSSVTSMIYCGVKYRTSVVAFAFSVVFGIAQAGLSGYLLFSVAYLIQYHIYLLRTGVLTKEDSGVENATVAGPFSQFDVFQNLRLNMRGMRQQRILRKVLVGHNYLKSMVVSNPYINSFDSLGRILGMQGYQQFSQARTDSLEVQSINTKLRYENIFTVRDGVEYSLNRAKQMVITSRKTIDMLRVNRPDLFVLQQSISRDKLSLVKCWGNKVNNVAKTAVDERYGRLDQIQVAGI